MRVTPAPPAWAHRLAGLLHARAALSTAAHWAFPALASVVAHVLLGPKQSRPVYLRVPGAMYAYAGVAVGRGGGCRGGCITGATGSGKTLACLVPLLHSLCVNERGEGAAGAREGSGGRPRHRIPPWGGLICGEKGNEWRMAEELLRHHGRPGDLRVLRTRDPASPPGWSPPVRFNLLSMASVPADAYARLLVETALSVEEADSRDEFFVPQARDKIAWGIRLLREGPFGEVPTIPALLEILTVPESYRLHVERCLRGVPGSLGSGAFAQARHQLESSYWSQPPEQLGGVRSTIHNFLAPYCEPEIAEVFCSESTLDLARIEDGLVVCLAVPQRHALQRRYVSTLLKSLAYQVVLQRFDRAGDPGARNVILILQDEWQRHAVKADCDVDVVREAAGAVYAATQSQNALWLRLGGREKAAPLVSNLRNRWICQAATEECADESSRVVSGRIVRELSYSEGSAGRTTNIAFQERPVLPVRELRRLRPFEVVFAPAEGPWLYRRCIAMPATPAGGIPEWWFGDWNPLHWAFHALGTPERVAGVRLHPGDRFVPPWRAAAPARAQARWLFGLDGTFVILGGRRASERG